MKNSERLGETRKGVRAARAGMGVVGGWGGSGENSPQLTYLAIADNPEGEERRNSPRTPEGGLAEKGLRRVWRIGGGIFGEKLGGTGRNSAGLGGVRELRRERVVRFGGGGIGRLRGLIY